MIRLTCIPVIIFISIISFGCSSHDSIQNVTTPTISATKDAASGNSHQLWGLYQFTCNPDAGTIDIATLRVADMHLNAIVFLEPPPLKLLTLEYLEFNGNLVTADIGLKHPFLGLNSPVSMYAAYSFQKVR